MNDLVTSLAIEGPDGQYVPLLNAERRVRSVSGLAGLRVREVIDAKPSRPGSINRSRYRDDKAIAVDGILRGSSADDVWAQYDALVLAFAAAVSNDRGLRWSAGATRASLQSTVRVSSMEAPVEVGPNMLRYQVLLRAGDPRAYAQTLRTVTGGELSVSGGGKVYPYTYPRSYNPAGGGSANFTVGGTDKTPPVLRIYGRCTAPTLRLTSSGEEIVLTGEVEAGEFLDVDVAARTVTLDDGTVRNNLLDFASSTWFELPVGPQTVQLLSSNFDSVARVDVIFRDAYA